MPKISEYPSATSVVGTEVLPIVQSSTTKKVTADILMGYKVFTANIFWDTLNEEFNNDVFKDTIGDLAFTRIDAGNYNIESAGGQFTQSKTFILINQNNNGGAGGNGNFVFNTANWEDSSNIKVNTIDVDVTNSETTFTDFLTYCTIEIRIYP